MSFSGRALPARTIVLAASFAAFVLPPIAPAGAASGIGAAGGAAAPVGTPSVSQKAPARIPTIATATVTSSTSAPAPTSGSSAGGAGPAKTSGAQRTNSSGKLSTGAILAAVIGGLLALACLVWAAFRWTAVEPRWTLPLRHSMAEAGFRASAVWAEFTDWIRLGH
jgi:hypothetical protein